MQRAATDLAVAFQMDPSLTLGDFFVASKRTADLGLAKHH